MINYVLLGTLVFAFFFTLPVEQAQENGYTCYGIQCVDPEPMINKNWNDQSRYCERMLTKWQYEYHNETHAAFIPKYEGCSI